MSKFKVEIKQQYEQACRNASYPYDDFPMELEAEDELGALVAAVCKLAIVRRDPESDQKSEFVGTDWFEIELLE